MSAVPRVQDVTASGLTRSASIAWLRVLAMVGVVLIHVSGLVTSRDDLDGTGVRMVASVLNGATRFCVPLFVLVSGALLLRPSVMASGPRTFYRRRLARLLPALVFWNLVYLAFRYSVLGVRFRPDDVAAQLLSGRVYTALYFFWLILGLYVVAPWLWNAVRDLTDRQRLVLGLVVVAVTCTWQATIGFLDRAGMDGSPGAQTIWTLWIPYVGYFLVGGALRGLLPVSRRSGWTGLGVALVGMAVTSLQVYRGSSEVLDVISPVGYKSVVIAATTIALWFAGSWFWREGTRASRGAVGRFGELLGSLTLGVFAIHLLVLYAATGAIAPGIAHGEVTVAAMLALCVFTLVVSWFLAWVASRVPGLRRLV